MSKNKPMLWVKLHTKISSDPTWRSSSLAARGLAASLLAMAGSAGDGGRIRGSDVEIAGLVGCTPRDLRLHLRNMPITWRRQGDYIVIANWPDFQGNGVDREEKSREEEIREEKTLATLPEDREWWDGLAKEFPGVDLAFEHAKALDWPGASRVKNVKNFFRNWVHRAAKDYTPDNIVHLPNLDLGEKAIVG